MLRTNKTDFVHMHWSTHFEKVLKGFSTANVRDADSSRIDLTASGKTFNFSKNIETSICDDFGVLYLTNPKGVQRKSTLMKNCIAGVSSEVCGGSRRQAMFASSRIKQEYCCELSGGIETN